MSPALDTARTPVLTTDEVRIREQGARLMRELQRRQWAEDPNQWAKERLGDVLWSGQRRILAAVAQHRKTAVMSSHAIGKSFSASDLVGWWLDTHVPGEATVITTAPTAPQVRAILWKEIGRVHGRGGLNGRVNQTEWLMNVTRKTPSGALNVKEEIVAMGRKPSDYTPSAWAGIHALYVLVIVDEANGVNGPLWSQLESLLSNEGSKMLAIGNPDVPSGEFYEYCKPGSGWHVEQVSAFDSPNFTGEEMPPHVIGQLIGRTQVEDWRRRLAPSWVWTSDGTRCVPPAGKTVDESSSPVWQSKVLGVFPQILGDKTLIPMQWIKAAQDRVLTATGESVLGQDVGGGGDSSTIAQNIGGVVRILHEDHNPDTMQTCGHLIALIKSTRSKIARVDVVGIGRGVVDRAQEVRREIMAQGRIPLFDVVGINVGEKPSEVVVPGQKVAPAEQFENYRAELWWYVRTRFEQGTIDIDPLDLDLAGELSAIRFERTSKGKIKIESKKDALARGVRSPNRADALMLALAPARVSVATLPHSMPMMVGNAGGYWSPSTDGEEVPTA